MKRSLARFSRLQKESHGLRLSSFAKFRGTFIPKRKQHGKEKMIFGKTTLTYLLANPNLEGEIHLKGVRFVTSLKSCFKTHAYHPCIHDHLGFLFKNQFKNRSIWCSLFYVSRTMVQCYSPIERLIVFNQAL